MLTYAVFKEQEMLEGSLLLVRIAKLQRKNVFS
jgi:hypothetical protein